MATRMKDYRPLLGNLATLLEDIDDYLRRPLQDDQLDTDFSVEDVGKLLEGVDDLYNEFEEEYGN